MSAGIMAEQIRFKNEQRKTIYSKNRGYCGNQTITNEYIVPKNKFILQ